VLLCVMSWKLKSQPTGVLLVRASCAAAAGGGDASPSVIVGYSF